MTEDRPRRGSPLYLTPARELLRPSYEIVKKNLWVFALLYVLPGIFMLHSWIWTPANHAHHWYDPGRSFGPGWSSTSFPVFSGYIFVGFSVLWLLIVFFGGFLAQIMSQSVQLQAAKGQEIDLGKAWSFAKKYFWRMVGLYLLVGLATVIGLILLVIPGIIVIRRYFLAPYILIDKKVGIKKAMEISDKMTKPYGSGVLSIVGVVLLISLLSVIPFIGWLLSLFLGISYSVAPALRYQELKKISQ